MISFLKGILALFIGLLVLQSSYILIAKNYDERTLQFERIKKKVNQKNPKVLIFGDSRVMYGVDHTKMGDEFLNVGFWSGKINFLSLKYSKILEENNEIKIVVFQLDHNTFTRINPEFYKAMIFVDKFDDYKQLDNNYLSYLKNIFLYNTSMLSNPNSRLVFSYGISKSIQNFFNIKDENIETTKINKECLDVEFANYGDRKVSGLQEKDEIIRKKIVNSVINDYLSTGNLNAESIKSWNKIVSLSKENNIKLIGLKMPKIISDEKTTKTLIELEKYIDQLELDHFLDYRNLFSNPNYFNDPMHLNIEGSQKFSQILKEDIVKLFSFETTNFNCKF